LSPPGGGKKWKKPPTRSRSLGTKPAHNRRGEGKRRISPASIRGNGENTRNKNHDKPTRGPGGEEKKKKSHSTSAGYQGGQAAAKRKNPKKDEWPRNREETKKYAVPSRTDHFYMTPQRAVEEALDQWKRSEGKILQPRSIEKGTNV